MRAAVIVFPGINAETEMVRTLRETCGASVEVVRHTATDLPAGTDLVAIPGGFSYGDYLRCGAIAKVAPVVPAIRAHADRGAYVLGVCNGFQILTEIGLLPGALTRNVGRTFICGEAHVRAEVDGPFTRKGDVLRLYVAHGEGRWQGSDELLRELEGEGRVALRYCDAAGQLTDASNLNGSASSVAGVYAGPRRNVFGLMPHPERTADPLLGGEDGRRPFQAVLAALG